MHWHYLKDPHVRCKRLKTQSQIFWHFPCHPTECSPAVRFNRDHFFERPLWVWLTLRSRWTTFLECMCSTAKNIWYMNFLKKWSALYLLLTNKQPYYLVFFSDNFTIWVRKSKSSPPTALDIKGIVRTWVEFLISLIALLYIVSL